MKKKGNIVWCDDRKESVKFEENEYGKWHIHYWKPNLFQRFMYWIGLKKDPRYNGKKLNHFDIDESCIGFDPYKKKAK